MSRNASFPLASCRALLIVGLICAPAAEAIEPFVGEITGNDVYVRSGPSQNYYPVSKLDAGTRVTVVSDENNWYAVVPPEDCYSIISKPYVDVTADGVGVVNGDAVRVRAGSDLDPHRYAVQLKLDKGAEVRILGETEDGFLKIAPPRGAQVWIAGEFVNRVPGAQPVLHTPEIARSRAEVSNPTPVTRTTPERKSDPAPIARDNSLSGRQTSASTADKPEPTTGAAEAPAVVRRTAPTRTLRETPQAEPAPAETAESLSADAPVSTSAAEDGISEFNAGATYRAEIEAAEARLKEEMAKPVADRYLDEVIALYRPIAEQEGDPMARMYAERRIAQLEVAAAGAEAVRHMRELSQDVAQVREDAETQRSRIGPESQQPAGNEFAAKGELRESLIYSSPVGPRRYRLIDPDSSTPRTTCYVEIGEESGIDVSRYLGRLVGVRASRQYIETGDVNPIPVVVAQELVVLNEGAHSSVPIGQGQAMLNSTGGDGVVSNRR